MYLEQDLLVRGGTVIDLDVTVGRDEGAVRSRLVGVPTPKKGYCSFLTNLPRSTHGPRQIGDLHRVRWEIEIDNKLEKTGTRLDEIAARTPVSVRVLLLASMIDATLARTIVQREKLAILAEKRAAKSAAAPRAPLHPIQTVRAMMVAFPLLLAFLRDEGTSMFQWKDLLGRVRMSGHDPDWRRRPSVLDTIQGLTAPPGRPKPTPST